MKCTLTKPNITAEGDMLCSLLQLARRLITHELGEQHSQSTGNNHEYAIIQQWKSARFTENESTNDSDNQPRRAEASHKDRLDEAAIAQRNRAAVAV